MRHSTATVTRLPRCIFGMEEAGPWRGLSWGDVQPLHTPLEDRRRARNPCIRSCASCVRVRTKARKEGPSFQTVNQGPGDRLKPYTVFLVLGETCKCKERNYLILVVTFKTKTMLAWIGAGLPGSVMAGQSIFCSCEQTARQEFLPPKSRPAFAGPPAETRSPTPIDAAQRP